MTTAERGPAERGEGMWHEGNLQQLHKHLDISQDKQQKQQPRQVEGGKGPTRQQVDLNFE